MTKLRPIGEYIETDVNGYLKNCASKKNISSPWKEAVSDLVDAYVENTPNIQAVYLRGSVPAGTAIKGVSDIDCFAILDMSEEKLQTIDLSWIEVQKAKLREKHPFVTKFEFFFLSRENIDFIWKFIIKT